MTPPPMPSGRSHTSGEGAGAMIRRRLLTHGALAAATILWALGLPAWVALALLVDLARALAGDRRLALLRAVLLAGLVLGAESWGVLSAGAMGLRRMVGSMDEESWISWHYRLQRRWGSALVRGAFWLYGVSAEIEGAELLDGRPVLLFMRHTSVADGVLLLQFVNTERGYRLRYVVKQELLADPCLDVVGHRIPNVFVRREGGDAAREVARVEALARGLGDHEGLMLFPEGTRFTPERKARALERLGTRGSPALVELGARLKHSLPPRPGGPLGAMRGAPEADVVLVAHVGLEGMTRLSNFIGGDLVGRRLRVRLWRFSCRDLPADDEGRYNWLFERWAEMDGWVDAELRRNTPAST